ncbi:DUF3598 family protein [Crocosphaera sp.]|uniref:DUF3598 family protein n=1 Tax=Crocosphaera sp. TaxID=2729996 RepID=UPI003F1F8E3D|nr:DUF3598 family protein [Crocosphaera sp.]
MDRKDQNVENFLTHHLNNWYGTWTKYFPNREIQESVKSVRSLWINEEKTLVFQKNCYTYSDETIKEVSWEFGLEESTKEDGLIHSKHPWMRSLFFEQGAALWVTKCLQSDSISHKTELFFKDNNLRLSVGTVYNEDGNLESIWNFKEDSQGFPSQHWSSDIDLLQERNFKSNWMGQAINFKPNLDTSPFYIKELTWPYKNHQLFFLPDGISLSCPEKIELGSPFKIIANWLKTKFTLQQLVVNYDENFAFSGATLEIYD